MYLLTHWLYGSLTVVVSLITDSHSSLSSSYCLHLLNFIYHTSFSTSSSHLSLDLPLLLPTGLLSSTLSVIPWSIFTTRPIHSNLFFLISSTISISVHRSLNSWLVPIIHTPSPTTAPHIFLNIFLSHVLSLFVSISVTAHISLPYTTTGLTIVLS